MQEEDAKRKAAAAAAAKPDGEQVREVVAELEQAPFLPCLGAWGDGLDLSVYSFGSWA